MHTEAPNTSTSVGRRGDTTLIGATRVLEGRSTEFMRTASNAESDKAILSILEEIDGEATLGALIDRLKNEGIQNESDIKAAIWRLIDQKKIEMTSRRELRSTTKSRNRAACSLVRRG